MTAVRSPLAFRFLSIVALFGSLLASGCTPVDLAVGAGATAAVSASQERGLEGGASDTSIRTAINYLWLDYSADMYHQLNLQVYEGRVLLTGVLASETYRAEAMARAWRAKGVKEVIDETVIDKTGNTGSFARDQWITTQLKSKLLFDKNVFSVNYSFETVRGVVYMLGVAQDQSELEIVLNYARNIEYVQRVVNHVLLRDDPRRANNGNKPASNTNGGDTNAPPPPASSGPTSGTLLPSDGTPGAAPRDGGTIRTESLD